LHTVDVTFTLSQIELVLDLATPGGCKAGEMVYPPQMVTHLSKLTGPDVG